MRGGQRLLINAAELTPPGAPFVQLPDGFRQIDFSAVPRNAVERRITRPKLSRLRASFGAVIASKRADDAPIISHMPWMAGAIGRAKRMLRSSAPHMAFAFNFTDLPVGRRRALLHTSLRDVSRFCVFSSFERDLYADYFDLPLDRFQRLDWTQDIPVPAPGPGSLPPASYVVAVGGEGRDYGTLVRAAERLPHIPFVVVARPYNMVAPLPTNVELRVNLPFDQTFRLMADASCMVTPLRSRETCCGHITLVSGHLLGVPMISTMSEATREYTDDVALCEPGDDCALAELIAHHHAQAGTLRAEAAARVPEKATRYSRDGWREPIADFLHPA
jgi:hypothetical protein